MAGRPRLTPTLTSLRSAISDGRALLDVDRRSAWARRLRDLIAAHTSDLGGNDALSEAERVLVRRAAMLTLQLELMEFNWAKNSEGKAGPKSIRTYQQCTNTLRRTLEALGLQRRSKDITPSLAKYIEHKSNGHSVYLEEEDA